MFARWRVWRLDGDRLAGFTVMVSFGFLGMGLVLLGFALRVFGLCPLDVLGLSLRCFWACLNCIIFPIQFLFRFFSSFLNLMYPY